MPAPVLRGRTKTTFRNGPPASPGTGRPETGLSPWSKNRSPFPRTNGFKASSECAAWVNGTEAHALDYDDYFVPGGLTPYHPTVAILPAVLALGEKLHASGREVLLSYITGFEVETRIALVCAQQSYDLGWHTTSTLGSIGAAAKLLRLSIDQICMALGIAASLAGGLRKNFGTMTKPLHAGNAARNGVIAAALAQRGFTADAEILDSPLSFGDVMSGQSKKAAPNPPPGKDEFSIVQPGIAFKPYPSCAYTHWAVDATLGLKKEGAIPLEKIAEIECHTSSALPNLLIHSRPKTAPEGKFSMEFCVSIALIDGEVTLRQFTDEKVANSEVQSMIRKVKYVHPPEMGSGLDNMGGRILVRLRNGEQRTRQVKIARGDPRNPRSTDDLISKYRDCVRLSLSPADAESSLDSLLHLEDVTDIAELMDVFTFGPNRK